ncbi:aldo/keto reductase [Nonomuraea cypriaca]|uniref:aldo/keto reductase n=1 Tax=Nonomuraea cypriaca TaxID=1187855 RepID=UPI001F4229EB|nr:aldo/keto reductase [Nonomuraea cypriaca]
MISAGLRDVLLRSPGRHQEVIVMARRHTLLRSGTVLSARPPAWGNPCPTVTSPSLGCLGLSDGYGPTDDEQGVRTIHAYLDAGGSLLDTGDFYGSGHNEWLIRQALSGCDREDVVFPVECGLGQGIRIRQNNAEAKLRRRSFEENHHNQ